MQSISADLTEEQKRLDQKYYRIVEMYKQYWTGAAYAWDAAVNINAWVKKVSTAKWKLDARSFNQWKSPSFNVEVDNRYNYWSEIEQTGAWRTGANQPYKPQLTKIRVRCGQYLPDGTQEDKYVFTGLIHKPIKFHDDDKTATFECIGKDEILRRKSAEGLSTAVADELLGSDAGTEFTTANNGVGGIPPVVKKGATGDGPGSATTLKAGIDYTLSDTNDKDTPMKVTLAVALTAGNSCWCSYNYWHQDKSLEWVVEELLKLAGETNYRIDPTIFAVDIENTWIQTAYADWSHANAVRTNVNVEISPGDVDMASQAGQIVYDFEGGTYAGWMVEAGSWSVVTYAGSKRLKQTSFPANAQIRTDSKMRDGEWSYKWMGDNASLPDAGTGTRLHEGRFIVDSGGNYYAVAINGKTGFQAGKVNLRLIKYSGSETELAGPVEIDYVAETAYTFKVTRIYSNGVSTIKIYVDDVEKLSASDDTITSSAYFKIWHITAAANTVQYIDDVNLPLYYATGNIVTYRLDTGAGNPTNWGLLTFSITEPSGTSVGFETYSSGTSDFSADNDPAGWVAIGGTGQINSAVKRYLKVRANFSADSNRETTPTLHELAVYYYTSSTTISLVNLTGTNVLTAIQKIAEMPCYEIGYDVDEYYFYRQRTSTGLPDLTIDCQTNLEKEISFNGGEDRVKNKIDVTFGDYRTIVDPDSKGESQPHSVDKYGEQKYTISGSSLLLDEGADVASATAQTVYAYTKAPRKRAQVQMRFLLQYQLGDIVKYLREHKLGRWLWGDTDREYCDDTDEDFVYYTDPDTNGWNINTRIEGIELDTETGKWRMKLDLVEIL